MFKERITKAQVSKNLGEVPVNEIGDVDFVRACGLASTTNPLGMDVWRWLYGKDYQAMRKVAEALVGMGNPIVVVQRVLIHLDSDVCPGCFGRGYLAVPGTPMLSDELCGSCKGAGRKSIQGEAEQALVEAIKRMERDIAAEVMRRLSNQIDL